MSTKEKPNAVSPRTVRIAPIIIVDEAESDDKQNATKADQMTRSTCWCTFIRSFGCAMVSLSIIGSIVSAAMVGWDRQPFLASIFAALIPPIVLITIAKIWEQCTAANQNSSDIDDREAGKVPSMVVAPNTGRCASLKRVFTWRRVLVGAVALGSYCFSSFSILSSRGLWCAYPLEYHLELCAHLIEIAKILDAAGIRHWMARGDSIALIRDGDVFPWEHDLDVCIDYRQMSYARSVLMEDQAVRHPNFTVHALAPFRNLKSGRPSPVLYVPLHSISLTNPRFSLNAGDEPFSLRTGEPVVVDLFPCYPHPEGKPQQLWTYQRHAYCHQSSYLLPFPSLSDMKVELDDVYPGWHERSFAHHATMCTIHVDRYTKSTNRPLAERPKHYEATDVSTSSTP